METIIRNYLMSDADLMMFVSNIIHSIDRDKSKFIDYAVSDADISAFAALGDSFEVFPPDIYYRSDVGVDVETRNATRERLLTDTRKITNRAIVKWGAHSANYKKFGVKDIALASDRSLLSAAQFVAITAEEYLAELAGEGLTQQIIDDYNLLAQRFENDMNAVYKAVETRDNKTIERIRLGNELYSFLNKYCRFGKMIWKKVNGAKYNDYLIYKRASKLPGKVLDLAYDLPAKTLSWAAAPKADEYQLQFKAHARGAKWATAYEGADRAVVHDPGAGIWRYRCRGRNAEGYGRQSDELEVAIPN